MGVVTIAVPAIERWYFTEIVRGAEQRARELGHEPRLGAGDKRLPLLRIQAAAGLGCTVGVSGQVLARMPQAHLHPIEGEHRLVVFERCRSPRGETGRDMGPTFQPRRPF